MFSTLSQRLLRNGRGLLPRRTTGAAKLPYPLGSAPGRLQVANEQFSDPATIAEVNDTLVPNYPFNSHIPLQNIRPIVKSFHDEMKYGYEKPNDIIPRVYTQALDLQHAYIGQVFESPYEITLTEGHRAQFFHTFFDYDRLYSSRSFAMRCGFPDAPMPFLLVLAHCAALNHVDSTRDVLDIGFENACYIQPIYPGDTVQKVSKIHEIRKTKDGLNTIVTLRSELYNQAKQVTMLVDKSLLYVGTDPDDRRYTPLPRSEIPESMLLKTIVEHAGTVKFPHTRTLFEGQCLLHHMSVPLGISRHLALLASLRQAHPRLVNFARFRPEEIVVPGVIVAGMAHAAASRALFEVLHEKIDKCVFVNKVSPLDSISSLTYVVSARDLSRSSLDPTRVAASGLCEVKVITVGIKNLDSVSTLDGVRLPKALFDVTLKPSEIEALVTREIPILSKRIAVISERTLVRQSHYSRIEQMPLL